MDGRVRCRIFVQMLSTDIVPNFSLNPDASPAALPNVRYRA